MPEMKYVMSIDSGTQSVKGVVFDARGSVVAASAGAHEPYYSLHPKWAEQDPHDYWAKLCLVTKQLMKRIGKEKNCLSACAVTSQRCVIIPVDKRGDPLRAAFSWFDLREVAGGRSVKGKTGTGGLGKNSKMNWVKKYEPRIFDKTAYFLSSAGWITHKLTGEFVDSLGMQSDLVAPFDLKQLCWSRRREVFDSYGCSIEQMPRLVEPGDIIGRVTKKAAHDTDLPKDLPIVASAGDKQCEVLGNGCLSASQFAASYGTAAIIARTISRYSPPPAIPYYYLVPSAINGSWNTEFFLYRGYWLVSWFVNEFLRSASQSMDQAFAELEKRAGSVPAGSEGLVVHPYWTPHPGLYPLARGTITGCTDVHTSAHFYRAILEGIAYALKDGLHVLNRRTNTSIQEIMVSGGGSRSNLAMQISADVLSVPTKRLRSAEGCALGAAMHAAKASGWFRDYREATEQFCKRVDIFEPNRRNAKRYNDTYEEVYKTIYPSLKSVFRAIDGSLR